MPRITIELDDETLNLLRKAAPPAGVSVVAHATNMPELPPWHTDVMLTERVMSRLWEALAEQGLDEGHADPGASLGTAGSVESPSLDGTVAWAPAEKVRAATADVLSHYAPVLHRLAE